MNEEKTKHPIQQIYEDSYGSQRFRENKIVSFVLGHGLFDLHELALLDFTDEDRQQFAQLIGYSLACYGSLPYVTEEASAMVQPPDEGDDEKDKRIKYLERRVNDLECLLESIRDNVRSMASTLFSIHPDDLHK